MEELIRNFGIDWKLLIAQAVNFFILFLLLKKFAYKPILQALKKRKDEIEKGLRFTHEAEEKIKNIERLKEDALKKVNLQALTIVSEAEGTAKKHKDEIVQGAHKKVETIIADSKRLIEQDKAKMGEKIYEDAKSLIRLGLLKVLDKLPSEEKDKKLIQDALNELKATKKYFS